MPTPRNSVPRHVVREVFACTGGKAGGWARVESIAPRLALADPAEVDRAIRLAKAHGWLEVQDGHSLRLTADGRHLAYRLARQASPRA